MTAISVCSAEALMRAPSDAKSRPPCASKLYDPMPPTLPKQQQPYLHPRSLLKPGHWVRVYSNQRRVNSLAFQYYSRCWNPTSKVIQFTLFCSLPPSHPWYFISFPPPSFTRFRDKRVSSSVSLSETPGPFRLSKNSTCPMERTFRSDRPNWPDRSKWTTGKAVPEYSGRTRPKWSVSFDVASFGPEKTGI